MVKRDHPRVCGEKLEKLKIFVKKLGSPPRVRGKETTITDVDLRIRITPACAGKSYPEQTSVPPS